MRISGTQVAQRMLADLQEKVAVLQQKKIIPSLAVILVGDDPASQSYIAQKKQNAENIGAKVPVVTYSAQVTTGELLKKIAALNDDPSIHGIIVQRPLPKHIDTVEIEYAVEPSKDIDGFHPLSHFRPPIALAVVTLLQEIAREEHISSQNFFSWLKKKTLVVIGKGESGGRPILAYLFELGLSPEVVTTSTKNADTLTKNADIIISAVGKRHILTTKDIKQGVILLSVGLVRGEDNKLHGDYDSRDIKEKAAYYTPSPGGVGPVNVAMLLSNLVLAAEHRNER